MYDYAAADKARADMTPGQRAAALYKEAQVLAEANMLHFVAGLETLVQRAAEIADGGDIYPTGVRDICRKLSETATYRAHSINSIIRNDGRPVTDLHARSLHEDDLAVEMTQTETPAPVARAKAAAHETPAPFPGRIVAEEPARAAFVPLEDIAGHLSNFGRRDGTLPGDFDRQQA